MGRWHSIGLYMTAFLPLIMLLIILPFALMRARHTAHAEGVFRSPLAGQWYPAERSVLLAEIQGFLDKAAPPPLDNIVALIQPHAGYRYSGQTAAYGMKAISGRPYKRIIVMGPSHRVPMENVASVPDMAAYATPLGETPLDTRFIAALKTHPCFQTIPYADDEEHSVQIHLPLLQQVLGKFQFVPVVVGDVDPETARIMADILRGLIDETTLVIASSDFTHYGPNYDYVPFREDVSAQIEKLDKGACEHIEKKDLDGFITYLDDTGATVCGRAPISILLALLPPDAAPQVLRYDTSGQLTGDYTNSVSYYSIAFTGKWETGVSKSPAAAGSALEQRDKDLLLSLARKTIAHALEHRKIPDIEDLGVEITPNMRQVRGAFVTLEENGELRGCIGDIFPSRPLFRSVLMNAINAAFNDRRFTPLQPEELEKVHIEISALTPPAAVDSHQRIVLGRDGVVLSKNGQSAVFLPQVAPEQGWDRDTMLNHLARKAGLDEGAWRDGASFQTFQADVFEEIE